MQVRKYIHNLSTPLAAVSPFFGTTMSPYSMLMTERKGESLW